MIRQVVFGLAAICFGIVGVDVISPATAREPDPEHFVIRDGAIEFDRLATDDDVAVLDDHVDIKAIYFSVNEAWDGPDPRTVPIAITNAGFAHVAKCKKLERLGLSSMHPLQVTDDGLKSLAGLSDLQYFSCGATPFTDSGIAHLASLTNLEELWLDFNSHLGDGSLETISQLKKLRVLRFHGAPITDAGIAKIKGLKNLEDLQLGRSQVGDAALETIGTFSKLKTLDLQHTRVTDAGMPHLKPLKLHWLCLHDTAVSGTGLAAISNMTDMTHLFLSYTKIDDAGLDHIARMKNLESCSLSGTHVTGAGLRKLASLKRISNLQLNDLPITDANVSILTAMKSLKHIELNYTQVTDAGFRQLSKAGIERQNKTP